MIKLFVKGGNYEIPLEFKTFSGGEEHVKMLQYPVGDDWGEVTIEAFIANSADLMRVLLLSNAIEESGKIVCSVRLTLPYIPYARQDRVCNKGEAFSLAFFVELIKNTSLIDTIEVFDPHSDEFFQRCDRYGLKCIVHSQKDILSGKIPNNVLIISPDKGSKSKSEEVAFFNGLGVMYAEKVRDLQTKKITSTELHDPNLLVNGKDCIILDDICDYGGTFIPLAEILKDKGARSVYLCVTNLIMPVKPTRLIEAGIDGIFYNTKFNNELSENDKVYHNSKMKEIINNGEK